MSHIALVCIECENQHDADMLTLHCVRCGSPLDVEYKDPDRHSIEWHGVKMPVPFHSDSLTATMGEGHTPVVPLPRVSEALRVSKHFRQAGADEPNRVVQGPGRGYDAVGRRRAGRVRSRGRLLRQRRSGRRGVRGPGRDRGPHIRPSHRSTRQNMTQIQVYGAETHPVPGPREASTEAALQYQREHGTVYASHNLSPYFLEGVKTFAYEVAAQMSPAPDHIVIPVGNGSLLIGAWKGYKELLSAGLVKQTPKLHAIQANAVRPIAAQFAGERWTAGGSTVASGISVGAPPRKSQVIRAISDTGGVRNLGLRREHPEMADVPWLRRKGYSPSRHRQRPWQDWRS